MKNKDNKCDNNEKRIERLVEDIRFTKDLSWRIIYYALLFNSGIIVLSFTLSKDIFFKYNYTLNLIIGIAGIAIIVMANIYFYIYQNNHINSILKYRYNIDAINELDENNTREEINDKSIKMIDEDIKNCMDYNLIKAKRSNPLYFFIAKQVKLCRLHKVKKYINNSHANNLREIALFHLPMKVLIITASVVTVGIILINFIIK